MIHTKKDGSVYFPILEAELAKHGIRKTQVQKQIGTDYSTLVKKINGDRPFLLREAIQIQQTFFPGIPIEELFRHESLSQQS